MLARLPGRFAAGAVNGNLVSLLDLMPTMLELAGVDYPGQPDLAGDSLLGAEGGGLAQKREDQVVEIEHGAGRWLGGIVRPGKRSARADQSVAGRSKC